MNDLRFEHERQMTSARMALDAERVARETAERKLALTEAGAKRRIDRLEADVEALSQTARSKERQLMESSSKFAEETGQLKSEFTDQVAAMSRKAEKQRKAMGMEVQRLRDLQDTVLQRPGREALTREAGGVEARRLLFYESMKSRALLQPQSTISWRGQQERPRSSRAAQTSRASGVSPPRACSP